MECSSYSTVHYSWVLIISSCLTLIVVQNRLPAQPESRVDSRRCRILPECHPVPNQTSAAGQLHHHICIQNIIRVKNQGRTERNGKTIGAHSFLTNFHIPHTHGQKSHGTVSLIYSGGQGFFYDFTIYVHCTVYTVYSSVTLRWLTLRRVVQYFLLTYTKQSHCWKSFLKIQRID